MHDRVYEIRVFEVHFVRSKQQYVSRARVRLKKPLGQHIRYITRYNRPIRVWTNANIIATLSPKFHHGDNSCWWRKQRESNHNRIQDRPWQRWTRVDPFTPNVLIQVAQWPPSEHLLEQGSGVLCELENKHDIEIVENCGCLVSILLFNSFEPAEVPLWMNVILFLRMQCLTECIALVHEMFALHTNAEITRVFATRFLISWEKHSD